MKLLLKLLVLWSFSTLAFAGTIIVTGKLTALTNYEGHSGPILELEDMTGTLGLCSRNDRYILVNPKLNTGKGSVFYDENYSLLLGARMNEMPVKLYFSDTHANKCVDNLPRIFHIKF